MTIRHFQIFKAVCDSEGVTAAAERLNITQPTVSIAIKELEAFYSTKLFDRINRKIYLTQAGETLRQYVDSVLEQYDEATAVLRNGKAFMKCRLGVNVSFAETHLTEITSAIQEALPECDLQIIIQNNEQLEAMLSTNQIDFAIFDGVNERSSKNIEVLSREKMVLLVSKKLYAKDTITIEELSNKPLLMREKGSGVRNCVDRVFLSAGLPQKVLAEGISTMGLLSLTEQGMGFMFVPISFAEKIDANSSLGIVELDNEEINRTYYLSHNERKHLTQAMKQLKNILLKTRKDCS